MKSSDSITKHFSRAAKNYLSHAILQQEVCRQLLRLTEVTYPQSVFDLAILDLGCGPGFSTGELSRMFPQAEIVGLDIAEKMIEVAKNSVANSRTTWQVADAREFSSQKKFDLIFSSSSIQWMDPYESTFERIRNNLASGGKLICSLMVSETLKELKALRNDMFPSKVPSNKLPSFSKCESLLRSLNFRVEFSKCELVVCNYPSSYDFLSSLRDTGVTGGSFSSSGHLLTRRELVKLISNYEKKYSSSSGVFASYEIAYFVASVD